MAARKERSIDPAKIQTLAEPVYMRLERRRPGRTEPIILPQKADGNQVMPPGQGWTRAEVLDFENFVLTFAGGGDYTASATDTNGEILVWDFSFKTSQFPEKIPFTMEASAASNIMAQAGGVPVSTPTQPIAPFQFATPAPSAVGSVPVATPQGTVMLTPQQAAQYQSQQAAGALQGQQSSFSVSPPTPWYGAPWRDFGGRRERDEREDDRIRRLEEALSESKLREKEKDFARQLDAERAAQNAQAQAFRDELRKMQEMMVASQQAQVNPARDELAQMREENRRREEEHRREMEKRDAEIRLMQERAERERREDEQERRHQEQMKLLQDQIVALREQPRGPDPMIEFLRENTRNAADQARANAEAQREATRAQLAQVEKFMEVQERSKGGVDQLVNNVIGNFGRMFDTYRTMMESVMGLSSQGQAGPIAGMVQQGLDQFGDIAKRYVEGKNQAIAATARSQAQQAQAQAQTAQAVAAATSAQLERERLAVAQAQAMQANGAAQHSIPPLKPSNGRKAAAPAATAAPAPTPAVTIPAPLPSEAEMFGGNNDVYGAILGLREHIKAGRTDPENAVKALLNGVGYAMQNNIQIPAFELFNAGRWSDVAELLLPDNIFKDRETALVYRAECVDLLVAWEKAQGDGGEEGEEEEAEEAVAN